MTTAAASVQWFLVAGQYWITVAKRPEETVQEAFTRTYCGGNGGHRLLTKPASMNYGEWRRMLQNHAVHQPGI